MWNYDIRWQELAQSKIAIIDAGSGDYILIVGEKAPGLGVYILEDRSGNRWENDGNGIAHTYRPQNWPSVCPNPGDTVDLPTGNRWVVQNTSQNGSLFTVHLVHPTAKLQANVKFLDTDTFEGAKHILVARGGTAHLAQAIASTPTSTPQAPIIIPLNPGTPPIPSHPTPSPRFVPHSPATAPGVTVSPLRIKRVAPAAPVGITPTPTAKSRIPDNINAVRCTKCGGPTQQLFSSRFCPVCE